MRWYPRHEWTEGMSREQLAEWNSASWPEVGGAGGNTGSGITSSAWQLRSLASHGADVCLEPVCLPACCVHQHKASA